jgi:hypothetical protein
MYFNAPLSTRQKGISSLTRIWRPKTLTQETVLLPDARELGMNAIYGNTLSDTDRLDLLGDYSALDVVLLTAETRGREHEVSAWVINTHVEASHER